MYPAEPEPRERLIDAGLNRVAEALRVVEDLCRFSWDLAGTAGELKALRHEILGALAAGDRRREEYLRARDIEGDVGRETPSPTRERTDLADVAFRNLQRAKEAIRSLEEACQGIAPDAAAALGGARYRLYAVEKGLGHLLQPAPSAFRLREARLCLLATGALARRPLADVVIEAIEAGVDLVQLREKTLPDREILLLARRLREITAARGVPFVVNDRPDIAILAKADGVHAGQEDLSPAAVRSLVGPDRIVGVSTHSVEQALAAEREGADYIGVGPMFPTRTKDAGPTFGPDGLREVLSRVKVPAFAIGGIGPENLREIAAAGGTRVAVSASVLRAEDPAAVVRALRAALEAPERS